MGTINHSTVISIPNKNLIYALIGLLLYLILTSFYLIYITTKIKTFFLLISLACLGIIFITLLLFQCGYEFLVRKIRPWNILILAYLAIGINAYLSSRYYSIEWAFLGFIIIGVIIYDSMIDSRFIILPAIILFGCIPFMIIGNEQKISENLAIYVYYFLILGIILLLFENIKNQKLTLEFKELNDYINTVKLENLIILISFLTLIILILNIFININPFKWTMIYLFFLSISVYIIKRLIKQK